MVACALATVACVEWADVADAAAKEDAASLDLASAALLAPASPVVRLTAVSDDGTLVVVVVAGAAAASAAELLV